MVEVLRAEVVDKLRQKVSGCLRTLTGPGYLLRPDHTPTDAT